MNKENWIKLEGQEYEDIWESIYSKLSFNVKDKESIIRLPIPNLRYDISMFYDDNFDEYLYDELHEVSLHNFKKLDSSIYALDWQHDCFVFNPNQPFELNEFNEWLIPVFPNGDYCFFVTKELSNGIFSDGINQKIYLWGENLIELFRLYTPKIFTAGSNPKLF